MSVEMTFEGGFPAAQVNGLAEIWLEAKKKGSVEGVVGSAIPVYAGAEPDKVVGYCRISAERAELDGDDLVLFRRAKGRDWKFTIPAG